MIYVALAELLLIAFLVWAGWREKVAHDIALMGFIASAELERAELLNRIQRPEYTPIRTSNEPTLTPEQIEQRDKAAKAYAQLGTIVTEKNGDG